MSNDSIIIFDLGGVVFDCDHMIVCNALAAHSSLSLSEIYRRIFLTDLEERYDEGRTSSGDFIKTLKASLGLTIDDDRIRDAWGDIFAE